MSKRNKIIYWVATIWLSLGLLSTGIVQIMQVEEEVKLFQEIGFPIYFMPMLGVWKILALIAIHIPNFKLLKEWAYAGIFFNMTGALYAHIINGSEFIHLFGPSLFLVLTFTSWYFRPDSKKLKVS